MCWRNANRSSVKHYFITHHFDSDKGVTLCEKVLITKSEWHTQNVDRKKCVLCEKRLTQRALDYLKVDEPSQPEIVKVENTLPAESQ